MPNFLFTSSVSDFQIVTPPKHFQGKGKIAVIVIAKENINCTVRVRNLTLGINREMCNHPIRILYPGYEARYLTWIFFFPNRFFKEFQ